MTPSCSRYAVGELVKRMIDLSSGKSAAGRCGKVEGASVSTEAEVKPEASLLASPRGELPSDAA